MTVSFRYPLQNLEINFYSSDLEVTTGFVNIHKLNICVDFQFVLVLPLMAVAHNNQKSTISLPLMITIVLLIH